MKALQSSVVRALIAVVTGFLLIKYRETATMWMTKAVGVMFFLSGLLSCITYYVECRRVKTMAAALKAHTREGKWSGENTQEQLKSPFFPVVGLGSMILGVILMLLTEPFIDYLMYVLGAILIMGAVNQFFNLMMARRFSQIPILFWIFPAVLLLVAVFFIFKPVEAMSAALLLPLGWCFIFYGVVECVNSLKIHRARKEYEARMKEIILHDEPVDAEIIEEEKHSE